jgi:hypothetical protein
MLYNKFVVFLEGYSTGIGRQLRPAQKLQIKKNGDSVTCAA